MQALVYYACGSRSLAQGPNERGEPRCPRCGSGAVEIIDGTEDEIFGQEVYGMAGLDLLARMLAPMAPAPPDGPDAPRGRSIRIGDYVIGNMDEIMETLAAEHDPRRPTPADPDAVAALPRIVVGAKGPEAGEGSSPAASPAAGATREGDVCHVCMDDFVVSERLILLPCGHAFHEQCLEPWLRVKNTCPVCRHALPEAPARPPPAPAPAAQGGDPEFRLMAFPVDASDPGASLFQALLHEFNALASEFPGSVGAEGPHPGPARPPADRNAGPLPVPLMGGIPLTSGRHPSHIREAPAALGRCGGGDAPGGERADGAGGGKPGQRGRELPGRDGIGRVVGRVGSLNLLQLWHPALARLRSAQRPGGGGGWEGRWGGAGACGGQAAAEAHDCDWVRRSGGECASACVQQGGVWGGGGGGRSRVSEGGGGCRSGGRGWSGTGRDRGGAGAVPAPSHDRHWVRHCGRECDRGGAGGNCGGRWGRGGSGGCGGGKWWGKWWGEGGCSRGGCRAG